MFSTASPDTFMSVTCAQVEAALTGCHWWTCRVLVFYSKCQIWLHSAGQWTQGPLDHIRPSGQPHKIFFWLFGQKHSHQSRSGGHFIELGNAHSDPLCTKERISVLLRGKGTSTALSSFPRVTACLLKSPSCFWDCAGAQIVFTYFLKSTKSHPYYCVNVFCHRVSHHARRMNNEMKWNSIFKN